MKSSPKKILLVEDNRADAVLLQDMLARDAQEQFDISWASSLRETLERIGHDRFDAILLDLSLPDAHGLDTITQTCAAVPATPILIITGSTDEHIATEAVRCGAEDYLVKGQTDARSLVRAIRYAIDRKRMQQERETTMAFLHLVNESTGTRDLIRAATTFLQKQSGCQAVGVRLKEGNDYPYFEARGFPQEFLLKENTLCGQDSTGAVLRDRSGDPMSDCLCDHVICGRFNPSQPFFTAQGSFWTNSTTELPRHQQSRSVGKHAQPVQRRGIPVGGPDPSVHRRRRLGLLQLNDQRQGMFLPEAIALWERLAGYLAGALAKYRAQEALEEADRRKDEFLATLAHELRNPLAPICNALNILSRTGDDEAAFRQVRGMMERQVKHLVRLVEDLLDVSRISRGKIELRKEQLDLAAVVHSAVETSRPLIDTRQHELTVTLPEQPLCVEGDAIRLAQVLSNLLNNAAKYTPNEGRIALSVKGQDEQAVIHVRDNGLGIPPEMLPHVFDMFMQIDRHLEQSQGGLGIGLTLVKSLVEMHGGTVEAHGAGLGQGSEFVVCLPLGREEPAYWSDAEEDAGEPGATPAVGLRVLVVDDNQDSANSLGLLIQVLGHDVRTVYDGPSALALAGSFVPDLVLLDIGMPVMDGFEVARRLRQIPALQKAVLVAQTGWGQEEDRRQAQEAGFDHHLVKPVDPNALRELFTWLSAAQ